MISIPCSLTNCNRLNDSYDYVEYIYLPMLLYNELYGGGARAVGVDKKSRQQKNIPQEFSKK